MDAKMNLIPEFILENFARQRESGSFYGSVLSVDIKGFTPMTEVLQRSSGGAEILSDILNRIYENTINAIFSEGGFVSSFAGDALTAVFINDRTGKAVRACKKIEHFIKKNRNIGTPEGNFALSLRTGIAAGKIEWRIITQGVQSVYFFFGEAVRLACEAQNSADPGKTGIVGGNIIEKKIRPFHLTGRSKAQYTGHFIPDSVLELDSKGEFRYISAVFISIRRPAELENTVRRIIEYSRAYGGFLNKVDYGDKGWVALVFFGTPIAVERPELRALQFSLQITSSYPGIMTGISAGNVFSGFIGSAKAGEHTSLGNVVNLAARLAMLPGPDVKFEKIVNEAISGEYSSKFLGASGLKGIAGKTEVFTSNGRKRIRLKQEAGDFIGRAEETAKAGEFIGRAVSKKNGAILYIEGPAGMGKTFLVERIKKNLLSGRLLWAYMPSDEVIRGSFNPFIYFLSGYFGCSGENSASINKRNFEKNFTALCSRLRSPELSEELKRTKSVLAALLDIRYAGSLYEVLDSKGRHQNTITALRNLILCLSEGRPFLMEFDDAQWIDKGSREVLGDLGYIRDHHVPVIVECRPNDDGTPFELIASAIPAERIMLDPFGEKETEELVMKVAGFKVDKRTSAVILKRSEGNPFYAEQICLYIKERSGEGFDIRCAEIPGNISTVIIARIDRLESQLREIVKTASVLGREFSVKLLNAMLKGDRLVRKNIRRIEKETIWQAVSEIIYVFKHALIRDAVYGMQLRKTLKRLHLLAARQTEILYAKSVDDHAVELAYHYDKAEHGTKAPKYLLLAAARAKEKFRNEEAIEHLERSLKYISAPARSVRIRIEIALLNCHIMKYASAEEILSEALVLAKKTGDTILTADVLQALSHLAWHTGKYAFGIECGNKAYGMYLRLRHTDGMRRSVQDAGYSYFFLDDMKKCLQCFELQLEYARRSGKKINIGVAYDDLGAIYNDRGEYGKAVAAHLDFLRIAKETGSKIHQNIAFMSLGNALYAKGEYAKAYGYFKRYGELSSKLGDPYGRGFALMSLGNCEHALGHNKKAVHWLEQSIAHSKTVGTESIGMIYNYIIMAKALSGSGEYRRAADYFKKALALTAALKSDRASAYANGNFGTFLLERGRYEKAEEHLKKALLLSERCGIRSNIASYSIEIFRIRLKKKDLRGAKKYLKKARVAGNGVDNAMLKFNLCFADASFTAFSDKKEAALILKKCIGEFRVPAQRAKACLELFKLTGERNIGFKALELYRSLGIERDSPALSRIVRILEKELTLTETKGKGNGKK